MVEVSHTIARKEGRKEGRYSNAKLHRFFYFSFQARRILQTRLGLAQARLLPGRPPAG